MAEESRVKHKEGRPQIEGARVKSNATSKKLSEAFLAEDVANARSYILWDVLLPNIKDVFSQTLHSAIDAVFGTSGRSGYGRPSYSGGTRTNYSKISSVPSRGREETQMYDIYTFDDIEIPDYGVARSIIKDLNEIIDEYGNCSVNDYFDTVREYFRDIRIDSSSQDTVYGWTSLRTAEPVRAGRGMWVIKFPRVRPLK